MFVAIGLVAIVVGLVTRPSSAEVDDTTLVGGDLTKDFKDPDDAKRLRIVRVDEDTATLHEFEVAEQDGLWSIPSKDGYPADAAQQMGEAATSLMGRKILQVASKNAGEHEQFGVIDPLAPKLEAGQKGIGTRVTMFDEKKDALVDLIIGKAVKGAEGQRYVREAGRDIVYIIEIDRSKLSTNFEDWIEKDLLKLNSWDLQQVDIKDYSAALVEVMTQEGLQIGIDRDSRARMTLAYNDSDAKWNAIKLQSFDTTKGEQGEYVDFTLGEDEELNEESLNGLKSALDDLQIVDVVRKPAGLSQDLKAGEEFVKNREALIELMSKGFTPEAAAGSGSQEIISSDGEVVATMKNGTEYVLRFGNLTSADGREQQDEAPPADPAATQASAADKKKDNDVNRYLFVMARLNESAVKQPELQQLPELPKTEAAEPAAPPDAAAAPTQPAGEGEAKPETETEAAEAKSADSSADAAPASEGADAEPAAPPEESATDAAKETETESSEPSDAKEDEAAGSAADAEKDKNLDSIIAERKRIEQENQRKLDEYQELLKKGRENVKELNLRFGDWYFVIDDDVFRKIRLGRNQLIKKKEKPATEAAAPADGKADPAAIPGLPQIPGASQ
jgi:hypothetical protein